ncbi:MFS transporter [Pseudomonas sp. NPDC088368]|jgi:MFS family permease|uniref:MFS transporter n=1 Tax=Pseudomonas sp. NPDC088368 TaxID=3364453 RepID=UPI0037F8F41D
MTVMSNAAQLHALATRRAMVRLIPLMCAIYFMSYLDRTNVALAKAALNADLGISAAAFGLGAGIFFIGYALLEVPSNLLAHRIGPRRWIARIAVTWGVLSSAMMFVQGEASFYLLRVLLGIAEAGLFPALMYMVTLWFAPKDRGIVIGWIYIAPALALVIGNPIGGALMRLDGVSGLHGWQWMFLLEGLPSVVVGVILWFKLPDRPRDARWLNAAQAQSLETHALLPGQGEPHRYSGQWMKALTRPTTILIGLIYFLNQVAFVGLVFFTPSIIQQMQITSPLTVGLLSSSVGFGFLAGVLVLPRVHRAVDRDTYCLILFTVGLIASSVAFTLIDDAISRIALFTATSFFAGGVLPTYWAIAMKRLQGIEAAAGLAFINTLGLLGGFVGPFLFGLAEKASGLSSSGFYVIVAAAVLGLLLVPLLGMAINAQAGRPLTEPAIEGREAL